MRTIDNTAAFDIDGLRRLRLWHWRQAMKLRIYELSQEAEHIKQRAERKIGFHLKQVQVLNDFFPMGDTAERDDLKPR